MTDAARRPSAHTLDPVLIVATIERLKERIDARFPWSGLGAVCDDLTATARATERRVRELSEPWFWLRFLAGALIAAGIVSQIYLAVLIDWGGLLRRADPVGITQGLDSVVNLLIIAGGAIWFVLTAEIRLKRKQILDWLYELRSIAHVIDMHQLTKYPAAEFELPPVAAVMMVQRMDDSELAHYLDYCNEMLALTAKLAALYAGQVQDSEVIAAVSEVEDLTSDLGRKIWQKILLVNSDVKAVPVSPVRP
jgi:hypothetical protein